MAIDTINSMVFQSRLFILGLTSLDVCPAFLILTAVINSGIYNFFPVLSATREILITYVYTEYKDYSYENKFYVSCS